MKLNETSKKYVTALALIGVFIFLSLVLVLSVRKQNTSTLLTLPTPTPLPDAGSAINLTQETSVLSLKQQSPTSIAVQIDTGNKPASAAQIALSYDPHVLTNIVITPGTFFTNPLTLAKNVDEKNATIFYALALSPNASPAAGRGTLATISYTVTPGSLNQTTLNFLPQTRVAVQGIDKSILKEATGISIPLGSQ